MASCWGFKCQPCGEGSVGGPVGGVDGVMGIPFPFQFIIFSLTFDFRRLFTPILKTAKRLLYLFADLRLGQLVSPLSGQPAINSVRWAPRFPILPAASGHAKRVVSSVAHNIQIPETTLGCFGYFYCRRNCPNGSQEW